MRAHWWARITILCNNSSRRVWQEGKREEDAYMSGFRREGRGWQGGRLLEGKVNGDITGRGMCLFLL